MIQFIAVMPFANAAGDPEDDAFLDSLTNGVINGLSAVPGLRVISRTSTFRYKGKPIVPRRAGRELGGVEALVVGRARQHGGQILLTVELIDARDDSQLWVRAYEGAPADRSTRSSSATSFTP